MNDCLTIVEKNIKNNASKIEESLIRIKKLRLLTTEDQEKLKRGISSLEVDEQLLVDLFSSVATLGGLKEYLKTEKMNITSTTKVEGKSCKEIIEKLKDIRQLRKFGYDSIVSIELNPLVEQMNELLAAYNYDMVNLKKYQSRKVDLLKYYERVIEVLNRINRGEIISVEEYKIISEEVKLSSLSREEKSHLLFDLVKTMSNKMNEKIKAYVAKEKQVQEETPKILPVESVVEKLSVIEEEIIPEEISEENKEEAKEHTNTPEVEKTPRTKLEDDELYQELVCLIGNKMNKMNSRFIVLNTSIKNNFDFNIREKNIYPSIKDLEEKIKFVLFDLKLNLLPALEDEIIYGNDTKIHKLISDVLRLYGTYTRQYEMEKEKNAFDCRTYLDTDDLSEYAIVYDDAAVLNEQVKLLTSSPASSKEYQLFISNCSVLLEQFLELFEQYKEWIFEYSKNPNQDTLDLLNDSAEELKEAMSYLKESYEYVTSVLNIDSKPKNVLATVNSTFGDMKNTGNLLFMFSKGNNGSSIVEDEIEHGEPQGYTSLIRGLKQLSTGQIANGGAINKKTSIVGLSTVDAGNSYRLLYKQFPTTLGDLFDTEPIKLIIPLSFRKCLTHGAKWEEAIEIAESNFYHYEKEIEKIRKAFTADFSNLSEEEKEVMRNHVMAYLENSMETLNEIIISAKEKNKKKGGIDNNGNQ